MFMHLRASCFFAVLLVIAGCATIPDDDGQCFAPAHFLDDGVVWHFEYLGHNKHVFHLFMTRVVYFSYVVRSDGVDFPFTLDVPDFGGISYSVYLTDDFLFPYRLDGSFLFLFESTLGDDMVIEIPRSHIVDYVSYFSDNCLLK